MGDTRTLFGWLARMRNSLSLLVGLVALLHAGLSGLIVYQIASVLHEQNRDLVVASRDDAAIRLEARLRSQAEFLGLIYAQVQPQFARDRVAAERPGPLTVPAWTAAGQVKGIAVYSEAGEQKAASAGFPELGPQPWFIPMLHWGRVNGVSVAPPTQLPGFLEGGDKRHAPFVVSAWRINVPDDPLVDHLFVAIETVAKLERLYPASDFGVSGETYFVTGEGYFASRSRPDRKLGQLLGETSPVLRWRVADPGEDLDHAMKAAVGAGGTAEQPREWPLTQATAQLLATKQAGYGTASYRDYRGRLVLGAWTWIESAQIGVIAEIDAREAEKPLTYLKWIFGLMLFSLALLAFTLMVGTFIIRHSRARTRAANQRIITLGQYEVEGLLAVGGMGAVYSARHSLLRRRVAIKTVRSGFSERNYLRFCHEAEIASQLAHPNTVAIYDFGRTEDGSPYYVMEYLPGLDLERVVKTYGPLEEARVLYIMLHAAASLHEAHQAKLVHRDVKPSNIMLCRLGGACDVVKVIDFGLVVLRNLSPHFTPDSQMMGTPHFMAPEQFQAPRTVDHRADVYALGAVAYYALTGTVPFDGSGPYDVAMSHIQEPLTDPNVRRPGCVSADFASLLRRCMEKKPEDRPASMQAIIEGLRSIEGYSRWSFEAAERWWDEHKLHTDSAVDMNIMLAETAPISRIVPEIVADRRRTPPS